MKIDNQIKIKKMLEKKIQKASPKIKDLKMKNENRTN